LKEIPQGVRAIGDRDGVPIAVVFDKDQVGNFEPTRPLADAVEYLIHPNNQLGGLRDALNDSRRA
jgi:hypothetical protein